MFLRSVLPALVFSAVLLAPICASAADRGPSTPEERKQALEYIRDYEANPLGPNATQEREWVVKWIIEVPDVHVSMCTLFEKLPKDKEEAGELVAAMLLAQTEFAIQHPDSKPNGQEEYLAGVTGAVHVYELLVKADPKKREPHWDDLVQRRDAGALTQWVQDRSAVTCKK